MILLILTYFLSFIEYNNKIVQYIDNLNCLKKIVCLFNKRWSKD